jgi:glycosyltransferase involved in cell wall biosynthesis
LKIVHLTSSLKMGGAETVLCDLIEGLGNKKFDHHVLFFHDGPLRARLQAMGIPTHQLGGFVTLYDPGLLIQLYCLLKKLKPDLVHSLLWAANNAARLVAPFLDIPVVSAVHNNVDQDGMLRNMLDRVTISRATSIVAVSKEVKQSLIARDIIFKGGIRVIMNGIDASGVVKKIESAAVLRNDLGLSAEHCIVGSVGRLEKVKNYPLLLKAFAMLHKRSTHVRLVLVGGGSCEGELRALAFQLGIAAQVTFIGAKQAYGYYQLFDCFVQSSNKEGISLALLEAMSAGIACVVTNENRQHCVIEHEKTGLLVKAGDLQGVVRALEQLTNDESMRRRLGAAGREHAINALPRAGMIEAYRWLFFDSVNRK